LRDALLAALCYRLMTTKDYTRAENQKLRLVVLGENPPFRKFTIKHNMIEINAKKETLKINLY